MIALLFLGRHLLVDSLQPDEAASIIRSAHVRDVWAQYEPLITPADGRIDRDVATEYAAALRRVQQEQYANVHVKRTWVPPIMVRQPAYYVRLTRSSTNEVEYYRVRGPFAQPTSRWLWMFPVL